MDSVIGNESLLALVDRPAFFVQGDQIIQANEAARCRFICEGDPLSKYLPQVPDIYREFTRGCLFLNLTVQNLCCPACVTRQEAGDLFVMDIRTDATSRSLALASTQLRQNLNVIYTVVDSLSDQSQIGPLNQALMQMHRVLCNMSDLARYEDPHAARMAATNLSSVFTETMEKCQTLLEKTGYRFRYQAEENVFGMADQEMIERALWNLLSNAIKFSSKNSTVEAAMSRSGNLLRFTIRDQGDGIRPEILQQAYNRYMREPTIEDSRHGIGLGLALVSAVAALHGGTVLIDPPQGGGTRVTMTMTIKPCTDQTLRSPVVSLFADYCGGHDHGLLELSDVLPATLYNE